MSHQFVKGDIVRFIPRYVEGQRSDCKEGIVTGTTKYFVLVRFEGDNYPQACNPNQLGRSTRKEL